MDEFLLVSSAFVLAMVAIGLVRVLRGPGLADRMMAAQLLGSGGIAALLLLGSATDAPAARDLALMLALLGAFASVGLLKALVQPESPGTREDPR